MAKASAEDLDMATDLVGLLDALSNGHFPDDDGTAFDQDDGALCCRAMQQLLELLERGSLMRVVYGMSVVLDPRNELIDPNADVLEHHPDRVASWASMDSAPKDGTPVLAWLPELYQGKGGHQVLLWMEKSAGWFTMNAWRVQPSHWRPLPAGPVADAAPIAGGAS